jgi:hypothetical protein
MKMDRKELLRKVAAKMTVARPRPPKGWFDEKVKEIGKNPKVDNPEAVAGSIWWNLSDAEVQKIKKRYKN